MHRDTQTDKGTGKQSHKDTDKHQKQKENHTQQVNKKLFPFLQLDTQYVTLYFLSYNNNFLYNNSWY